VAQVFQSRRPEGFFSEVVDGVSDARFSRDARFVFARDYLSTKVWDVRSDRKPLLSIPVHDFLEDYLRELHKNECIFDKFTLSLSPDGSHCVTGSYDSNFVVQGVEGAWCETVHASSEASRPSERPPANVRVCASAAFCACLRARACVLTRLPPALADSQSREMKEYVAKMDFAKKSLQVCWHPRVNAVAVGSLNKVYIYQARSPPPAAAAPAAAVAAGAASAGSDGAKRV
jgi:serine/threonine-protein phosphatase 2A regulatory subunit B